MSAYSIEVKYLSKNGYFTPAEAKGYYGHYSRDGIAVHWWNEPHLAGTHDQTVDYLHSSAAKGNTSANYVVSDAKLSLLVSPDNVAWASGAGNPSTISIEFDPRLGAEGYRKGGWLINELEERYGKRLPLYPHSKWVATNCPGTIDLNRLRREADKFKNGTSAPAREDDVITDAHKYLIRVISSEVKGWNRKEVHSGKLDAREMKAWKGQSIAKFSQQAWSEGAAYRAKKDKWENFYSKYSGEVTKLKKENADLKKQLANSGAMDTETKDAIRQTNENVGWVKNLLNKLFK